MTRPEDTPWLRETVSEELAGLFVDDRETVSSTVSRLLERLPYDPKLTVDLVGTLQVSIEEGNDETQGSVWIALILGEAAVAEALPTLIQALASDQDEELQGAAGVAILKCGPAGVEALIEAIEDETPSAAFLTATYALLGWTGYLKNDDVRRRVMNFLSDRFEIDEARAAAPAELEALALAAARVGHRQLLPLLRKIQEERFGSGNAALRDALEMLEENQTGAAITVDTLPAEEDYRWAFQYDAGAFRPLRDDAGEGLEQADPGAADDSMIYRGLGGADGGSRDGNGGDGGESKRMPIR